MTGNVCAIVGAGPGNGAAMARHFASAGYRVALLARGRHRLESLASTIAGAVAVPCDVTDEVAIARAFAQVSELGRLDTLIYNAGNFVLGTVHDTRPQALEGAFALNCTGCLLAVQRALPGMLARGSGTIIVIGATASRRGSAGALPFATAKAGQRVMAESMARALGPLGIHVAYVTVDGVIDTPDTRLLFSTQPDEFFLQADAVARTVLHLAEQPRSAWTFELELRPFGERW